MLREGLGGLFEYFTSLLKGFLSIGSYLKQSVEELFREFAIDSVPYIFSGEIILR